MSEDQNAVIEGELKLILHRLEELSKNQDSSFAEVKTRISAIEGDLRSNAVWQGKMEQRVEHIEAKIQDDSGNQASMPVLAKMALGALATALAIITALVTKGQIPGA